MIERFGKNQISVFLCQAAVGSCFTLFGGRAKSRGKKSGSSDHIEFPRLLVKRVEEENRNIMYMRSTFRKQIIQVIGMSLIMAQFFMTPMEVFAADVSVIENEEIAEETVSEELGAQEDVTAAIADTVILELGEVELEINETMLLTATAYSEDREVLDVVFEWNSNAPDIVEVDNAGKITAKTSGQAVITVCSEGIYDECIVDVLPTVGGIAISTESLELKKGESSQLTAEIWPEEIEGTVVLEWSSSNQAVAEVDENGTITAVGTGQAIITVQAESYTSSCKVIVLIPIKDIVLSQTGMTLKKGRLSSNSSSARNP